jgi:hypothetical protein
MSKKLFAAAVATAALLIAFSPAASAAEAYQGAAPVSVSALPQIAD